MRRGGWCQTSDHSRLTEELRAHIPEPHEHERLEGRDAVVVRLKRVVVRGDGLYDRLQGPMQPADGRRRTELIHLSRVVSGKGGKGVGENVAERAC